MLDCPPGTLNSNGVAIPHDALQFGMNAALECPAPFSGQLDVMCGVLGVSQLVGNERCPVGGQNWETDFFIHLQCWEVLPFLTIQRQRCINILCPKDPEFYTPLALTSEEDKRATTNVQNGLVFSFYSLLFSFRVFELKQ